MHTWWVVGPVGLSAVLLRGVFGRRGTHRRGKKDEDPSREEGGLSFSCERVCTSEALLKRLGSLAKVGSSVNLPLGRDTLLLFTTAILTSHLMQDPTLNTCVTVCGTSGALAESVLVNSGQKLTCWGVYAAADACAEACQRAVCSSSHQVHM